MDTQIIDGRQLGQEILSDIQLKLTQLSIHPKLLILQVGEDPASTQYVELKKKKGTLVGIEIIIERIEDGNSEDINGRVSELIAKNKDLVDGIMIQLPLPQNTNTEELLALIPAELDVDGLTLQKSPWNTAVANAVLHIMRVNQEISRTSTVLVLGEAPYVGASIVSALKKEDYEYVTSVNENTPHKAQHLRKAKVVISCIGKPHIYHAQQLHKRAVLIDVGTSEDREGKIVGDFDVSKAQGYLSAYTPVPGGVGPMTVAMLLKSVSDNAIKRHSR